MGRFIFGARSMMALMLVLVMGTIWVGCTTTVSERRDEPGKTEGQETKAPPPPSKYQARYYQFDDILVPGELSYDQGRSLIYESYGYKAGVMVFTKWWLDRGSVVSFFLHHMEKDNWKLVNSFSGKESIMNFAKPNRTCTIRVFEKWTGTTEVKIAVGPLGEKKN